MTTTIHPGGVLRREWTELVALGREGLWFADGHWEALPRVVLNARRVGDRGTGRLFEEKRSEVVHWALGRGEQ